MNEYGVEMIPVSSSNVQALGMMRPIKCYLSDSIITLFIVIKVCQ